MKTSSDNKDRFVIIMAGGRGERFWPVSRERNPKQLLTLLGDRSFLQQAVDRVLPLVPPKNIFIITNEVQAPGVRKQLPKLPKANVIAVMARVLSTNDGMSNRTLASRRVGAWAVTASAACRPGTISPPAKTWI